MTLVAPGVCRHCNCHGDCRLAEGDECMWFNRERTVCSRPDCIIAEAARKRAAEVAQPPRPPSPYRGWGKGAIDMEMRRLDRKRRRKRRAA